MVEITVRHAVVMVGFAVFVELFIRLDESLSLQGKHNLNFPTHFQEVCSQDRCHLVIRVPCQDQQIGCQVVLLKWREKNREFPIGQLGCPDRPNRDG